MKIIFPVLFLAALSATSAPLQRDQNYMLPLNCSELLPDPEPFISFFNLVAQGAVTKQPQFSKRMFRVLALKEQLSDKNHAVRDQNPVEMLIRQTLCYYRQQKAPLRAVAYDDPDFLKFLTGAMPELEKKVDEAILKAETEKAKRQAFEQQIEANRKKIESLQSQAERDADHTFKELSREAKKKAQQKK